jgi:hypothetical protein
VDMVHRTMQRVASSFQCATNRYLGLVTIEVLTFNVPSIVPINVHLGALKRAAVTSFGRTCVQVNVCAYVPFTREVDCIMLVVISRRWKIAGAFCANDTASVPVPSECAVEAAAIEVVCGIPWDMCVRALKVCKARGLGIATMVEVCIQAPHVGAKNSCGIGLVQMSGGTALEGASTLMIATSVPVLPQTSTVDTEDPCSVGLRNVSKVTIVGVAPSLMATACVSVGVVAYKALTLLGLCTGRVDVLVRTRVSVAFILFATAQVVRVLCAILVQAEGVVRIGPVVVAWGAGHATAFSLICAACAIILWETGSIDAEVVDGIIS